MVVDLTHQCCPQMANGLTWDIPVEFAPCWSLLNGADFCIHRQACPKVESISNDSPIPSIFPLLRMAVHRAGAACSTCFAVALLDTSLRAGIFWTALSAMVVTGTIPGHIPRRQVAAMTGSGALVRSLTHTPHAHTNSKSCH